MNDIFDTACTVLTGGKVYGWQHIQRETIQANPGGKIGGKVGRTPETLNSETKRQEEPLESGKPTPTGNH